MNLNTFSFRAECRRDVADFIDKLPWKLNGQIITDIRLDSIDEAAISDVLVELKCTYTYQEVLDTMRCVADRCLMIDTLQECRLGESRLKSNEEGKIQTNNYFYSTVEMFGKKVRCRVCVWLQNQEVHDTAWDRDLYIERSEDWYALSSPQLKNKRVRVILREDFLSGQSMN